MWEAGETGGGEQEKKVAGDTSCGMKRNLRMEADQRGVKY